MWMHYLIGVSHFTKCGTNRLLIVWELRKQKNANKCPKIAYSSVVKKMKVIWNPRANPDHHQKSITSIEGHLMPVSAKFGRSLFPRSSVILFTEWQNEWKNDRELSHNIRLIGGGSSSSSSGNSSSNNKKFNNQHFFHLRVATPFLFFRTKRYSNILMETTLTGASNARGVGRSRDSDPIPCFIAYCELCDGQLLSTWLSADTRLSIDSCWS